MYEDPSPSHLPIYDALIPDAIFDLVDMPLCLVKNYFVAFYSNSAEGDALKVPLCP